MKKNSRVQMGAANQASALMCAAGTGENEC